MLTQEKSVEIGRTIQEKHEALLNNFQSAFNGADNIGSKLAVIGAYESEAIQLRQEHWAAVTSVQMFYPVDLNPLDPAQAIVKAVRDDIADTEANLHRLKSSNIIGLQIANLKKTAPVGVGGAVKYALNNAGIPTGEKGKDGEEDSLDKIFKIVVAVGLGVLGIFGAGLFLRARGK